jgi:hypothetical protein
MDKNHDFKTKIRDYSDFGIVFKDKNILMLESKVVYSIHNFYIKKGLKIIFMVHDKNTK